MKKLFLVALMLVGLTTFAQDKRVGKAERPKLSSDEKVEKQVESYSEKIRKLCEPCEYVASFAVKNNLRMRLLHAS